MEGKRRYFLIGVLSLADIIVLISLVTSLPSGMWNDLVYTFDLIVVASIAFSFTSELRQSQHWRKHLINNWYEILGMIPIVVFAFTAQKVGDYEGLVTLGIMLRLLTILYLAKLSRSIKDRSILFGGRTVLHTFIILFLVLIICSYLFYEAERSDEDSQINNMGDSLWWTIQTFTTSTFGPNAVTTGGKIVGSIIMFVGIGIASIFISTLASGLIRSRTKGTATDKDAKEILKIRLAKGELTKEVYLDLLKLISQ